MHGSLPHLVPQRPQCLGSVLRFTRRPEQQLPPSPATPPPCRHSGSRHRPCRHVSPLQHVTRPAPLRLPRPQRSFRRRQAAAAVLRLDVGGDGPAEETGQHAERPPPGLGLGESGHQLPGESVEALRIHLNTPWSDARSVRPRQGARAARVVIGSLQQDLPASTVTGGTPRRSIGAQSWPVARVPVFRMSRSWPIPRQAEGGSGHAVLTAHVWRGLGLS